MLRFNLGRIPVEVHPSHLLVSALFALGFKPTRATEEWPARILATPDSPGYAQTLAVYVLGWMAVFFVSVLIHELGHAVVSRAYGYRPSIRLMWLGGHTQPNPNETIPWNRDVVLTLAGPGFGFALAAAAFGLHAAAVGRSEIMAYFFELTAYVNTTWTVLNLMPVPPLDGGRVSLALLMRLFKRPGFLVAQGVALLFAGGLITLGLVTGPRENLFLIIFFSSFAFRAVGLISAYFRGEAPGPDPLHPNEAAYAQALALLREDKRAEAGALLDRLLAADPAPALRGRAHHLRGWVAIKEGRGQEALGHFSQAGGERIEPQATAAALSLIGDDARALPSWELAARETQDATVLHEWAGTLIRLGRVNEARQLSGVQWGQAVQCAQRV
ncbi:MAG TPA: site-2 protease family protein, partial [Myxococcaceae bacterium]|nr:site-2 protease family protein [Myxococcaceae bacterium]